MESLPHCRMAHVRTSRQGVSVEVSVQNSYKMLDSPTKWTSAVVECTVLAKSKGLGNRK